MPVAPALLTTTLIFTATALVGVWAAPDRFLALRYVGSFLLGFGSIITLGFIFRSNMESLFGSLALLCAFLAACFALYFVLTVNWATALPHRLPLMQRTGVWIHTHSLELSNLPGLQKNMVGAILLVCLPVGLSGSLWTWCKQYRLLSAGAGVALLIGLFGLLMTSSRGAWLGFGLATGYTLYFGWRGTSGRQSTIRRAVDLLLVAFSFVFIAGFPLLFKIPVFEIVPSLILGDSTGRTALWRDSIPLIRDYPLTGSGLGSTTMVYSSYVFLLHVPFLAHAHNLYLQIAIEQGLPGLIAFVTMTIFAIWGLIVVYRHGNGLTRGYSLATFAALIAVLGHGLVEAELYAHLLRPILFLPFGFTLILLLGNTGSPPTTLSKALEGIANRFALLGSLAPLVAIAALFLGPGSLAGLYSNLGAVAQTRAELAAYHWPEWPLQDELRRTDAVDLSAAVTYYQRALALDPTNVTAHRRLGQIALSKGKYEAARQHLEIAYDIAPTQRATRQLLGEIYAINGDPEKAVTLWQSVDTRHGQLQTRQWWHTHIGADRNAVRIEQTISRLNTIH